MAIFANAITPLLKREGMDTITEVPGDFGGLTKYGISQKAYPGLDIRNLTALVAMEIYKRDYWDCLHLDDIPNQPIAEALFDAAVNHGVTRSVMIAQKVLGNLKVDGIFGPQSLLALNLRVAANPSALLGSLVLQRMKFYSDIVATHPEQIKFLHGWLNRALEIAHV